MLKRPPSSRAEHREEQIRIAPTKSAVGLPNARFRSANGVDPQEACHRILTLKPPSQTVACKRQRSDIYQRPQRERHKRTRREHPEVQREAATQNEMQKQTASPAINVAAPDVTETGSPLLSSARSARKS